MGSRVQGVNHKFAYFSGPGAIKALYPKPLRGLFRAVKKTTYELQSKLLVSPLLTRIVVPYIIPYIVPIKKFRLQLILGSPGAKNTGTRGLGKVKMGIIWGGCI